MVGSFLLKRWFVFGSCSYCRCTLLWRPRSGSTAEEGVDIDSSLNLTAVSMWLVWRWARKLKYFHLRLQLSSHTETYRLSSVQIFFLETDFFSPSVRRWAVAIMKEKCGISQHLKMVMIQLLFLTMRPRWRMTQRAKRRSFREFPCKKNTLICCHQSHVQH